MPRSTAVHGVVESFFKSKKYIVPSAVVSPIFAGCVAAVYVGSGGGRFDPAQNALVFNVIGVPETPMGREDRRAYRKELEHLLAARAAGSSGTRGGKSWRQLQSKAFTGIDDQGRPVLQLRVGEKTVRVGATAANVLSSDAPSRLVQELLLARLQAELRQKSSSRLSGSEIERDWNLLQNAIGEEEGNTSAQAESAKSAGRVAPVVSLRTDNLSVNRP